MSSSGGLETEQLSAPLRGLKAEGPPGENQDHKATELDHNVFYSMTKTLDRLCFQSDSFLGTSNHR